MHALNALRQMKSKLAITAAEHRRVCGEADNFRARGHGALHHALGEITVALNIKLEPKRLARVVSNFFNGRGGKCTDRQDSARSACTAHRGQFAFRVEQAMIGNRRQQHGKLKLATEKRKTRVNL